MKQFLVNIDVDDLQAGERFYCTAFGLKPGRRFANVGMLELVGGSARIFLLSKCAGSQSAPGAGAQRSYDRHWTPVHLDFLVDDIRSAVQRSVAAGGRLEQPISTYVWGEMALMSDPFGHGYCLIAYSASGYDAIAAIP